MTKARISVFIFLCIFQLQLLAQGHEDVFPLLYGTDARDAVANAFTPNNILNYNNARDTLYKNILAKNDSLTCVYSGHTVYMDPNEDPTTTIFQNGGTNGINTEHTWPQAYGAGSGNPRSNMYHLFPTRIKVNEARSNFPFAEITDAQTQAWYYLNQVQTTIPTSNIERYSEYRQGSFEPREDFKGDIARAMFYFYTIYNQEASTAPAGFFSNQIPTLYQWHQQDPVDQAEWERNAKIAPYQEDKSNPYILDSTLVERAFCAELGILCTPSAFSAVEENPELHLRITPNPVATKANLYYTLPETGSVRIQLFNTLGQELTLLANDRQDAGAHLINLDRNQWSTLGHGLAFCRLVYELDGNLYFYTLKVVFI